MRYLRLAALVALVGCGDDDQAPVPPFDADTLRLTGYNVSARPVFVRVAETDDPAQLLLPEAAGTVLWLPEGLYTLEWSYDLEAWHPIPVVLRGRQGALTVLDVGREGDVDPDYAPHGETGIVRIYAHPDHPTRAWIRQPERPWLLAGADWIGPGSFLDWPAAPGLYLVRGMWLENGVWILGELRDVQVQGGFGAVEVDPRLPPPSGGSWPIDD